MFYSWIPLTCIYFAYDHPDEIWVQRLFSILYPSIYPFKKHRISPPLKKKEKRKKEETFNRTEQTKTKLQI